MYNTNYSVSFPTFFVLSHISIHVCQFINHSLVYQYCLYLSFIIYDYIKLIADNSRAGFEKRQKRRQIRALQEAIDRRDTTAVEKILEDDFDVDFQYRSQTALQLAVREGCYNICKLLIDRKANVNMSDAEQNNLLNLACSRGIIYLTFLSHK